LKGGEDMSNLSKLVSFLALLEKVPITKHLGNSIRKEATRKNTTLRSFFIQPNKLYLFSAVCIQNRDGPIIGFVTHIELNLKDEILTLFFEDDKDYYKIPFKDLVCMKIYSNEEAMMLTKALLNVHPKKTKVEGTRKCPNQIIRLKSVRI